MWCAALGDEAEAEASADPTLSSAPAPELHARTPGAKLVADTIRPPFPFSGALSCVLLPHFDPADCRLLLSAWLAVVRAPNCRACEHVCKPKPAGAAMSSRGGDPSAMRGLQTMYW